MRKNAKPPVAPAAKAPTPTPAKDDTAGPPIQPPRPPRFVLIVQVDENGNTATQAQVYAKDVSTFEVARILAMTSGAYFGRANERIATVDEQQAAVRRAAILRDYPAVRFSPAAKVSLCAACADVYGRLLEGGLVELPPSIQVPCDYHLDETRRPMPYEEAAKLAAADPNDDAEHLDTAESPDAIVPPGKPDIHLVPPEEPPRK